MITLSENETARTISDYELPNAAYEDIDNYLKSRKEYWEVPTRENLQSMYFFYEMAYTSIKHCVVNGVIPQSEMWRLVDMLCEY